MILTNFRIFLAVLVRTHYQSSSILCCFLLHYTICTLVTKICLFIIMHKHVKWTHKFDLPESLFNDFFVAVVNK